MCVWSVHAVPGREQKKMKRKFNEKEKWLNVIGTIDFFSMDFHLFHFDQNL